MNSKQESVNKLEVYMFLIYKNKKCNVLHLKHSYGVAMVSRSVGLWPEALVVLKSQSEGRVSSAFPCCYCSP